MSLPPSSVKWVLKPTAFLAALLPVALVATLLFLFLPVQGTLIGIAVVVVAASYNGQPPDNAAHKEDGDEDRHQGDADR